MSFINVVDVGVVIRCESLRRLSIDIDALSTLLEFDMPFDGGEELISFGPCFGREAADEFCRRLEGLGLQYVDDFFVFTGEFPEWCKFKVGVAK